MALAQAHTIQELLQRGSDDLTVEIVTIRTSGDRGEREQRGAFVKEIQDALLECRIDVGQHCLKDLPTGGVDGLELASYLPREDSRDALISKFGDLHALPEGSVIGTGSIRRTAQLALARPDLKFRPLVGNVDTRLRKLVSGEYDAIILAIAGLIRLNVLPTWASSEFAGLRITPLDIEVMLPAPGQAILVLECRSDDLDVRRTLGRHDHQQTRAAGVAERAFLAAFGGGCSVPVAAYALGTARVMSLMGRVCSPDGAQYIDGKMAGSDPEELGVQLASEMGSRGAFDLYRGSE